MFTFHQLQEACNDVGYNVTIHQYDCGERVTVRYPDGKELFSTSKDCGEEPSAVDITTAYMLAEGYIRDSDIPDAKPDED